MNVVLRNLENTNYKYISRRTLKSIPKENQYIVKNTFDVITVLFSLRKINFEKFIASNVDDFYFHLILDLLHSTILFHMMKANEASF